MLISSQRLFCLLTPGSAKRDREEDITLSSELAKLSKKDRFVRGKTSRIDSSRQ